MLLLCGCGGEPVVKVQPTKPTKAKGTIGSIDKKQSKFTVAQPDAEKIVLKASEYLWSKQADDGSWKSENYELHKSGRALTPFVLYALTETDPQPPKESVEKALAYMRAEIRNGAMSFTDAEDPKQPFCSTAYALMCFKKFGEPEDKDLIHSMQQHLVEQQFTEARGLEVTQPAYGGWGAEGKQSLGEQSDESANADIAHTRRAIQALAMEPSDPETLNVAKKNADYFLKMVQKHPDDSRAQPMPAELGGKSYIKAGYDGGFYGSPGVLEANKGRLNDYDPPFWNSYATATCEGLLSLLAAGATEEDVRVSHAMDWLEDNGEVEYPEGVPAFYEGENWQEAVHFYHLALRGEVRRALELNLDYRDRITDALFGYQKADGSFVNTRSSLMKEDDPVFCTALAIQALGD